MFGRAINTVDSRYLEHALSQISRYLELFSRYLQHYGLLPYKMSRYLELRYLELFANQFFGRKEELQSLSRTFQKM